ncbi:MAG: efflux RND transporter periplasmic adaptor subunit [Acidobacteria bacterium]|nr:MAG: efflux RND transporter periplasmic adaptor subunit [Acidobacteriota bacterium]
MATRTRVSRIVLVVVAVAVVAAVLAFRSHDRPVTYAAVPVDRGDIQDVVGATGTVQAVQTVQVGSQVSGTIQNLYADFNSVVHKGQVIARLDPSSFQARLGQAQAALVAARANVDRSRAAVDDARRKLEQAKALAAEKLLPQSDFDTAQANYDQAVAQVKANQAAVSQAQANVNQAKVDLDHTVIAAPIDGVVIARSVDVGQTVAASFQAPVLFVIANDLKHMEVNASVDEADIGRVRTGQEVTFRVDAYPDRTFHGRVTQVRLQPTTVQNVVTYNTIISVDNDDGRLMPGMTATVSVIVRKSQNALRIPAAALRFRPEGFDGGSRGRSAGAAGGTGGSTGPRAAAAPGPAATAAGAGPGGTRAGGRAGGWSGRRADSGGASGAAAGGAEGDSGRTALVFVLNDKGQPEPVRVHTGVSDGQFVEVKDGLTEGARVVVGIEGEGTARPAGARPSGSPSTNPFNPQFQRRQR